MENSRFITTWEQGCPSDLEIGPDCLTRPRGVDINTRAIELDSSTLTLTASVNHGKCFIQCWIWRVGYWVWPQYSGLVTWWRVEKQDLLITSKTYTFKPDFSAVFCFACIYVVNCIYKHVSPVAEIELQFSYLQTVKLTRNICADCWHNTNAVPTTALRSIVSCTDLTASLSFSKVNTLLTTLQPTVQ